MTKRDTLDTIAGAINLTLDRATAYLGEDAAQYIPVFRKGIEVLVHFIRQRGHKDAIELLDTLSKVPPESM